EWKPFRTGEPPTPLELLQLAVPSACFLLDVPRLRQNEESALRTLLTRLCKDALLLGFGLPQDAAKVAAEGLGRMEAARCLDLQEDVKRPSGGNGLAEILRTSLHRSLPKEEQQLRTVMKIVNQHDKELRDLEAWSCHTFLLPKEQGLGKELLQAMTSWKARIPDKGAHPLGPPRWTVAGTVAQALLQDEANLGKLAEFKALHESMTTLQDMEQSIQLAMARETRDGKVLLKLRPQVKTQAEWAPALEILGTAVTSQGGEIKSGPAPPSALIRQIADKKE
ncbi:unnamed protein product, partial [Symbiodinium sp. CCMP2456]